MKFRIPFSKHSNGTPESGESSRRGLISASIPTIQRNDVANTLDLTIQTIQAVTDLVPIAVAKSILIGITNILSLLQKSLKNEDDLKDLRQKCWDICSTLARATKGVSMDRVSDVLRDALSDLKSSIDTLYLRVDRALQYGRARKFLTASLQAKEISAWTAELSMTFLSFSTRLNIVSSIRQEQMFDFLMRTEVPNLIPAPPPPPPAMFFGREALFAKVKDALLHDQDVALIGAGGIGKSCIAKALINDEDIKKRYGRRFFIAFDGMDPKMMTLGAFVDRVAGVLGLPLFGAESARQVISNLSSSPVLVVLDNAETFEDAADPDVVTEITSFVAEIATTQGVTVILTSRTINNARNVRWTRVDVPPLERVPARLYFRDIYHGEISDDDVDTLLDPLDFHPLSIHILAYTAEENRWTGKTLLDRWNSQQSGILHTGNRKENLSFTITLSLDSPSVQALGDHALRVLCTIAFLPQGINENNINRLFPSVPEVSILMDTLCRMSLVYRAGVFLTTLAPVRLHLLDTFPGVSLELLGDIRDVYYNSLRAISKERDSHADLVISDHLNIEHLIAFDFARFPENIPYTGFGCARFLTALKYHKLRPTLLSPIISSLPETSMDKKKSKARCLDALGGLYYELANYSSAGTAYLAASALFAAVEDHNMAMFCTTGAALSYKERGRYSWVQQLLEDIIHSSGWPHIDGETKAEIHYILDMSRMHTSSDRIDELFLHSMDYSHRSLDSRVRHQMARMYHSHSSPAETEKNLQPLRSVCLSSYDVWDHWRFFSAAAETALLQRRFDAAMELLNEGWDVAYGNLRLMMIVLESKAIVACVQGDYELARSLLQYCLDTLGVVATPSSGEFLWMLYIQGFNEMYAGDYSKAHQLFSDVIKDCEVQDEAELKTYCLRALGEVGILLDRKLDSDRYFAQTMALCHEIGVPPNLLGICEPMLRLDEAKFPGWKQFLLAHATAR